MLLCGWPLANWFRAAGQTSPPAAAAAAGCILIALVVFGMMTYASGIYPVGSIDAVWNNLQVIGGFKPVENNRWGMDVCVPARGWGVGWGRGANPRGGIEWVPLHLTSWWSANTSGSTGNGGWHCRSIRAASQWRTTGVCVGGGGSNARIEWVCLWQGVSMLLARGQGGGYSTLRVRQGRREVRLVMGQ
jgi:hypothetical protein